MGTNSLPVAGLLLLGLAGASAFTAGPMAGSTLPLASRWTVRASGARLARMCNPSEVQEETREAGTAPPPPPQANPLTRTDRPWFERTTALDREQRINGDPLAPRKRSPTPAPYQGQTMGNGLKRADVEREGYEWYVSMESQRSMFGRTLNPLTGELEKKGEDVPVMNPLVDPIFYVILSVGAPFVIMFVAAYSCVVPALSLALGANCQFY
eukprot:CAMPEP_0206231242 /NCGR_PEP_ID=MMETSP0047_2-20121206/10725_1 /ASSEMBLY_ACC=CAM_ASM_000192 /TAXON_ID=195065 /ORGANISM="Chroomonas mesostigmatica_cf, Strain CCMP1168" /LENGTH=210 /DNA_ID=CAMNT_0053654793 /DNA_START=6 /DNA_END=638 /DNA_ORIENTATION=-